MTKKMYTPHEKDTFVCPHCGGRVQHKAPYIYSIRHIKAGERIQIIDSWNVPYSTGIFILADDDVTEAEVDEFVKDKVNFPFWPARRLGILWAKNTWDD